MDVEALIRAITKEVLKQVHGTTKKETLLIFGEKGCPKGEAVQKRFAETYEVVYFGEGSPEPSACKRLVIPSLTIGHMAGLASAKADGPLMEGVLASLLSGQTVEVMEYEYRRYEDAAPEGLLAHLEAQKERLETFGLVPMDLTSKETVRIRKALVTEADIEDAIRKNARKVWLPQGTQITPLAVEHAKNAGILIARA